MANRFFKFGEPLILALVLHISRPHNIEMCGIHATASCCVWEQSLHTFSVVYIHRSRRNFTGVWLSELISCSEPKECDSVAGG